MTSVVEARPAARRGATVALVIGTIWVILSRWLTRPQVPDDYDSMNFVLAIDKGFDLAKLQPQFPGYPVFVALAKVVHWLGASALTSASVVSIAGAAVGAVALGLCAWRLRGPAAVAPVLALFCVAWQPWLLGSSALSESFGVGIVLCAFAALALERPRPFASALLAGLALGARASYWPLVGAALGFAALASATGTREPFAVRLRPVAVGCAVGLALWAVPFVAVVGWHDLWSLAATHLAGHFSEWGGTVVTRPNPWERLRALVSGVLGLGFAPAGCALLAIGAVLVISLLAQRKWGSFRQDLIKRALVLLPLFDLLFLGRMRHTSSARPFGPVLGMQLVLLLVRLLAEQPECKAAFGGSWLRTVGWAVAPYALWAFFAQNIIDQPRHLLPLVVAALVGLGCILQDHPWALAACCALALAVNVPLAIERRQVFPAAVQGAQWLNANVDPAQTLVVGTRSPRFFRELAPDFDVRERPWLSQVIVELSRMDVFPKKVLLTSEVDRHSGQGEGARVPARWRFRDGPTFCRDSRIDHFQPCLTFSELTWNP